MRSRRSVILPLMQERSVTVHIRLIGGDAPTGEVIGDDAVPAPFAGWLDLMQTIERLAAGSGADTVSGTPTLPDGAVLGEALG